MDDVKPLVAKQGHIYSYLDRFKLLAMESGSSSIMACRIYKNELWPLGRPFRVDVDLLTPLPMVYFHGRTPE